jgi:hypothetical protein
MPAATPPDAARKVRLGKPAVSDGWVPEGSCGSCVGILFSLEEDSIGELRALLLLDLGIHPHGSRTLVQCGSGRGTAAARNSGVAAFRGKALDSLDPVGGG